MAAHPDINLFCDTSLDPIETCKGKKKEEGPETGTPSLVDLLKKIYHGNKHASNKEKEYLPERPDSEPILQTLHHPAPGTTLNELVKQKILVQYLKVKII